MCFALAKEIKAVVKEGGGGLLDQPLQRSGRIELMRDQLMGKSLVIHLQFDCHCLSK